MVEKYANVEELTAAVAQATHNNKNVKVLWCDYQTFAQVVIEADTTSRTVIASTDIVALLKIGGQFWNVRYTKEKGLYALFTFEKTQEAEQVSKAKAAELNATIAKWKAERKAKKAAAKAAPSGEVA